MDQQVWINFNINQKLLTLKNPLTVLLHWRCLQQTLFHITAVSKGSHLIVPHCWKLVRVLVELWLPICIVCFTLPEGWRGIRTQFSVFLLGGIALSFEGAYSEDLLKVEHLVSLLKLDRCLCFASHVISSLIHQGLSLGLVCLELVRSIWTWAAKPAYVFSVLCVSFDTWN